MDPATGESTEGSRSHRWQAVPTATPPASACLLPSWEEMHTGAAQGLGSDVFLGCAVLSQRNNLCWALLPQFAWGKKWTGVVQDGRREDGANPDMGKQSINSTFRFQQFPSARHSLSFQRQPSVLALNGRPSEDGNSGLCKLYKGFLSPSNSTGTVQNQESPPQPVSGWDSAQAPQFSQGNTETFRSLIKSTSSQPPFSLGIFMWKNKNEKYLPGSYANLECDGNVDAKPDPKA